MMHALLNIAAFVGPIAGFIMFLALFAYDNETVRYRIERNGHGAFRLMYSRKALGGWKPAKRYDTRYATMVSVTGDTCAEVRAVIPEIDAALRKERLGDAWEPYECPVVKRVPGADATVQFCVSAGKTPPCCEKKI